MPRLPQPPRRGIVWRRHVLALVGAALLAGCANGDFQEVRPTLVRDDIHDWVGRDAIMGQATSPSRYALTDDERALRDLAYPLIEPPYDRHQWYSVAGEYGVIGADHRGAFDRAAYWNHLVALRYRSPSARYAQLADDIRNDATRLPQFFEAAARVLDIDAKRRKSLAIVSRLAPAERDNALRRNRENAAIVALVRGRLAERVAGYRFALERLVIQTPSMQAAGVERDLHHLQERIAYYATHRAPTWVREQSLASAR
jgi:hypothetical protein